MKIRIGFVSNSSSTSFTCEICGEEGGGMDAGPEDFGMIDCEKEHVICQDHIKGDWEENEDGYLPSESCPICNLQEVSSCDLTRYLLVKNKTTNKEAEAEIIGRFKTYQELLDFIKPKKEKKDED